MADPHLPPAESFPGHLIEGTVERHPFTDLLVIRTADRGKIITIDIAGLFKQYEGQEIRLALVPTEEIRKLEERLGQASVDPDPTRGGA
jgi:hypothetical protein